MSGPTANPADVQILDGELAEHVTKRLAAVDRSIDATVAIRVNSVLRRREALLERLRGGDVSEVVQAEILAAIERCGVEEEYVRDFLPLQLLERIIDTLECGDMRE